MSNRKNENSGCGWARAGVNSDNGSVPKSPSELDGIGVAETQETLATSWLVERFRLSKEQGRLVGQIAFANAAND